MTIENSPKRFDPVENPAHYNKNGGIEAIESIEASMTPEAFKGFLKGNVLKYVWRYEDKNGLEDIEKAKWYLDRLSFMLELEQDEKAFKAMDKELMECEDGFCPMPNVRYDKPPETGVVFPPIKD